MTDMLRDWARVKAVFEQAVALDAAERSAFLAATCGSDAVLRQHVDALLASHESSESFLEESAGTVLDLGATDVCGRTIGTYTLLARIGAGAMGEVYLAQDAKLNRRVAVKLIAKHLAGDPNRLRRFRDEAHAVSSLNHPHIVVVHDFGDAEGRPFIVTELVEGQTLRARLQSGPMPIDDAIAIGLQVAGALSAAHARGLVHRDIKPENVMVRPDGYAKVLDFGLAKLAGMAITATAPTMGTHPGHAAGTPSYMSPEQARAEPVDARTDVFSFGAVLYEMVTGRMAFPGDSHAEIFAKILGEAPPPASDINPRVSPDLRRIIAKALAKDRELRYQSAADMRADLLRLGRQSEADFAVAPPKARTRVAVSAMIAAVALMVVAAAAYALRTRDHAASPPRSTRAMLAVLPFEDLSDDRRDDYFADGLTDEMIAQLGELQPASLGVIARKSTVRYKNSTQTAAQIGRELGVDYLLEGSVRRAGDRVRVIAQLVNAASQTHLWSETYERPVTDVLSIQAEIANQLTRSLSIQLLPRAADPPPPRTINLKSYDKYLLGLHELKKGTRESGANAIAYFKEGIANDPSNARIHAALGQAYTAVVTYYSSPAEVMPLARASAERALALDPDLAAAHVTLGTVHLWFDWDWAGAEREYRRALEINPNSPEAQLGYATYLATLGRFDEAIARVQQAYLFDPLAVESRNEALWIYYFSGRMRDTIEQARKAIQIEPGAGLPYALSALGHAHLGERAEALKAAADADRPGSLTVMTTAASALARIGEESASRQLLARALALAKERYVCRFIVAAAYVDLGDRAAAFQALEEAYLQRST